MENNYVRKNEKNYLKREIEWEKNNFDETTQTSH